MLARIETMPGVLAAWTDRQGGTIVIATSSGDASEAERIVRRELTGRSSVTRLGSPDAERAIAGCLGREPGWFRAAEVNALSREEARVLALRAAERAAAAAELTEDERSRLEDCVRAALVSVFEEHERRKHFDGRRLDARLRAAVLESLGSLDLPPAKLERLRAVIARD